MYSDEKDSMHMKRRNKCLEARIDYANENSSSGIFEKY